VQAFPNNIFTSVIKAVSDLFLKVRPPVHSLQAVSTRPSWTLPLTADEACWQLSGLCTTSGTAPAHSCACLPLLVSHTHTHWPALQTPKTTELLIRGLGPHSFPPAPAQDS